MAVQREAIFAALFTRLQAISGLKTVSRKIVSYDDLPQQSQPALYLYKGDETIEYGDLIGVPPIVRMGAELYVYARADNPSDVPSAILNDLLTAIDAAFEWNPQLDAPVAGQRFPNAQGYGTSLGGLCVYCRTEGTTRIFEGEIGGGAIAQVPVRILTTG